MKYDLILFDFDDTLLSFKKCEQAAFKLTLEEIGVAERYDEIFPVYTSINKALWGELEQGLIKTDFLRVERFQRTIDHFKLSANAESMSNVYMNTMPELIFFEANALEVCKYFSNKIEIGIITNGIGEVQRKKLKKSGLDKLIKYLFISDECGFAKPDIRFFEHMQKNLNGISKDRILIVGDRLETDVKGANDFGIDSCWYKPYANHKLEDIKPKYEIKDLLELKQIVQ